MYIKTTYVGTLKGVNGMWCGFKPEDAEVDEERQVLFPEEGHFLKKGEDTFDCIWLKDGDEQSNYEEIAIEDSENIEILDASLLY